MLRRVDTINQAKGVLHVINELSVIFDISVNEYIQICTDCDELTNRKSGKRNFYKICSFHVVEYIFNLLMENIHTFIKEKEAFCMYFCDV